jgi:hypothetical protein
VLDEHTADEEIGVTEQGRVGPQIELQFRQAVGVGLRIEKQQPQFIFLPRNRVALLDPRQQQQAAAPESAPDRSHERNADLPYGYTRNICGLLI